MNTIEAINQLDKLIEAEHLQAHCYTLYHKSIQVVLLSSKVMPSHPILARGIAILSPKDEPDEQGILLATQRAYDAYKTHQSTLPIIPSRRRGKALFPRLIEARNAFFNEVAPLPIKSWYAPTLPSVGKARRIEQRIIERLNREALGQGHRK